MQDSPSFFSDPKVIVSIIALLISIVTLIWTLFNQWEQNRRWENLNNANIDLKEVAFIRWKELARDEATNMNWGYTPLIYNKEEGSNLYILPYRLIVRDSSHNIIENVNPVYTLSEAEQELKRIKYKGSNVAVSKSFRPKFIFENMGKTVAKELSISIDIKQPNNDWQNAYSSNAKVNLNGGQSSNAYFDFEFPTDAKLPAELSFKVILKFKDVNDKLVEKETLVKWISSNNYWSYGD